jgi:hypothetical protein
LSTITTRRSRASLALATALALVAATFSIGMSPASANVTDFATVTGHAPQSSTNNQVATWCGSKTAGTKIEPVSSSPFQLEDAYRLVVVKAGANQQGNYANTLFAEPAQGQWVWADTNGNGEPEIGTGDKDSISHIIVCFKDTETPPNGSIKAIKKWTVTGPAQYADGKPGDLLLNDEVRDWDTSYTYAADTQVRVAEDTNGKPPTAAGWTCTVDDDATTYQVGSDEPRTTPPLVTITSGVEVLVSVTNVADCTEVVTEPAQGSVQAVKQWTVTGLDPKTAPGFAEGTPGTLTFNDLERSWTTNTTSYDVNTMVEVKEAGNGTAPTARGYKCTIDTAATTYTVGQTTDTTPPTVTVTANTTVTVTVTNKANCTQDITEPPAATTLTVTKVWAYVGTPDGYPALGASNAGSLNVTVGGTPTGQAWGATKSDLKVGDTATVSEGQVPAPATYIDYTCSITGSPEYAVNGADFTTAAASFPLAATANTVTVRNTVTCKAEQSAVGGTEDTVAPTADDSDSADDEKAVAGSEDELAATGANAGPAGLGLLLILSGVAFITVRRMALK